MKTVFALLSVLVAGVLISSGAHAEVREKMTQIVGVKYNGADLEIEYRTGGGCAEHRGEIVGVLDTKTMTVTFEVFDVASEQDMCRAFIFPEAKLNVTEKVTELLRAAGLPLDQEVKIVLPEFRVYIYAE